MVGTKVAELLDAARALGPEIRERAEQIEAERALPRELVQRMTEAGLFGMAAPIARGGAEVDPVAQIDVVAEVAYHDASVGWCLMIGCDNGYWSSWVDEQAATELWRRDPLGPTAIMINPAGMGRAVEGGYRVTGRWPFGSGRLHSDVVGVGFLVGDAEGRMRLGDNGMPEWRVGFVHAEETVTVDTWRTTGLAGTGSHDFTLTDVFIPHDRTADLLGPSQREEPLYRFSSYFLAKMGGVAIGVGRRAVDELVTLASTKVQMPAMNHLRDEPFVQAEVARAEALVGSARSWLRDVTGELYETVTRGDEPSLPLRGRYRLAITNAFTSSKAAVEIAYELAGSGALYRPSIFDRCLRDITTACQHVIAQRKHTVQFGRALLGLEPQTPFV